MSARNVHPWCVDLWKQVLGALIRSKRERIPLEDRDVHRVGYCMHAVEDILLRQSDDDDVCSVEVALSMLCAAIVEARLEDRGLWSADGWAAIARGLESVKQHPGERLGLAGPDGRPVPIEADVRQIVDRSLAMIDGERARESEAAQ